MVWFMIVCHLDADLEAAKIVAWLLEMCVSDTATFFPRFVGGTRNVVEERIYELGVFTEISNNSLVLFLQLPMPQLENIMKKFPDLRPSLTAYANQPTIKASLPK